MRAFPAAGASFNPPGAAHACAWHRFILAEPRAAASGIAHFTPAEKARKSSWGWAEQGNRPGVAPQNRAVSAGEKMNGARPVALPR